MLNLDTVFHNPILKRSNTLIKFRLWFYAGAYVHLVAIASLLLTIDFSKAEDPNVRAYQHTRWKLITTWFNLLTVVYFPICMYCDWRELRGEGKWRHIKLLNQMRDLCLTSILVPTTAFGDILFWRIWNKDRNLIAPPSVDKIVPFWTQHCMHTISLIQVLIDLVIVPRKRPKDMTRGITLLSTFLACYIFVCGQSFLQGEYVYPGLKYYTGHKLPILVTYVFVENFFYYTSQWLIVDMFWGPSVKKIA